MTCYLRLTQVLLVFLIGFIVGKAHADTLSIPVADCPTLARTVGEMQRAFNHEIIRNARDAAAWLNSRPINRDVSELALSIYYDDPVTYRNPDEVAAHVLKHCTDSNGVSEYKRVPTHIKR
jgi:hypothetical protein